MTRMDPSPIRWYEGEGGRQIPVLREYQMATARGEISTIFEVSKGYAEQMAADLAATYEDGPTGKQVTKFTATELRAFTRLYAAADGMAGGGVRESGEIAALYSLSGTRGSGERIVKRAIADGGAYLECFDTFLPRIYERTGMTPVARVPFNREFAPDDWDYEGMVEYSNGEPDIVFMVASSRRYTTRRFDDYDAAEAYARRIAFRHDPNRQR